ncbi:hypothetical protein Tco_1523062 [Tanacetum coccineum]
MMQELIRLNRVHDGIKVEQVVGMRQDAQKIPGAAELYSNANVILGVALEKFILFIQLVMEYRMKNKQQQGLRSDQKHNTFTPIYPAILEIFIGKLTSVPRKDKSTWFTACANCKKSLEADLTWIVSSPSCHQESEVEPLSRMIIQIDDGTSSLCTTLCAPDIEKTVPYTTVELKQADEHIEEFERNLK